MRVTENKSKITVGQW